MGATGVPGTPGTAINEFDFSTGGTNQSSNNFVGVGSVNSNEAKVAQITTSSGTLTTFRCFQSAAAGAARTFTLRLGTITGGTATFANTTLTCTIPSGSLSGVGAGVVAYVAGQTLDIALPATTDNTPASIAVG